MWWCTIAGHGLAQYFFSKGGSALGGWAPMKSKKGWPVFRWTERKVALGGPEARITRYMGTLPGQRIGRGVADLGRALGISGTLIFRTAQA
jgi:hypothetical protein